MNRLSISRPKGILALTLIAFVFVGHSDSRVRYQFRTATSKIIQEKTFLPSDGICSEPFETFSPTTRCSWTQNTRMWIWPSIKIPRDSQCLSIWKYSWKHATARLPWTWWRWVAKHIRISCIEPSICANLCKIRPAIHWCRWYTTNYPNRANGYRNVQSNK